MPSAELAHLASTGATNQTWSVLLQALQDRLAPSGGTPEADNPEIIYTWRRYRELVEARNAFVHGSTASVLLVPPAKVSETTIEALVHTRDAYAARQRAHEHHSEAVENHQSKYLGEWQQRVKSHSERSHENMLSSLWESGLSWRDIARLLKVSIAAVQKWRSGEKMAPKNFARLRDFVAAYDTVAAHKPGVDIASWLDVPILTDVPVTPRNLWTDGDPNTFFEYALGDLKPEAALDTFDSAWRQRYRDDGFESFVGEDGLLSIRTKNR
jgi:DNA-binding transcriptional regulator YiaG